MITRERYVEIYNAFWNESAFPNELTASDVSQDWRSSLTADEERLVSSLEENYRFNLGSIEAMYKDAEEVCAAQKAFFYDFLNHLSSDDLKEWFNEIPSDLRSDYTDMQYAFEKTLESWLAHRLGFRLELSHFETASLPDTSYLKQSLECAYIHDDFPGDKDDSDKLPF